jgi:hypothetical protein
LLVIESALLAYGSFEAGEQLSRVLLSLLEHIIVQQKTLQVLALGVAHAAHHAGLLNRLGATHIVGLSL